MIRKYCLVIMVTLCFGCKKTLTNNERFVKCIDQFTKHYPGMTGKWYNDFDIVFYYKVDQPQPANAAAFNDDPLRAMAIRAKQEIIMECAVARYYNSYKYYFVCTFNDGKEITFRFVF